jgi:cell division protein FtsB
MAAVLAVVLGYYVVDGHNGLTVYKQKRIENREMAEQIERLKQENARLKEHVDRLQADPDAIEHEAREKLHYTRPGEVIYTLNDATAAKSAGAGAGPQNRTGK